MDRRLFIAAGLGAVACNRDDNGPPVKVRLGVAGIDLIHNLPLTLAKQLGFYGEETLDVEIEDLPSGSDTISALGEAKIDAASNYYTALLQSGLEGQNLKAFLNLLRYPGLVVVASPRTKLNLRLVDQLSGATIGMATPDTAAHFLVNYLLGKRNVKRDSVRVQDFGRPQALVEALVSGNVDAAVLAEPALSRFLRDAPKAPILLDMRTAEGVREAYDVSEYPGAVVYSSSGWVEDNHATCLRLARAFRKTLAWIGSHTAEQIADKVPVEYRQPDPSLYVEALVSMAPIFSPNGALPSESAEMVRRVLEYSRPELKQTSVEATATFTNEFVDRAGLEGS
jgi:NitT/TauT family transport system substrate-binding protein